MWLDIAREHSERWVHQQQIRRAVGRPGLDDAAQIEAVMATFAHALAPSLAAYDAPAGTAVERRIIGEDGGAWHVERKDRRWLLRAGHHPHPAALVTSSASDAWRAFTLDRDGPSISVEGDASLGQALAGAVAILT